MVIEAFTVLHLMGKGSVSTGRSSISSSRSYSRPSTSTRSSTRSSAPKTSTPKSTAPKTPPKPKEPTPVKKQYTNTKNETVVYRDGGINWFQQYFLFGWLWHHDTDEKCFDANHKQIDCKEKKQW